MALTAAQMGMMSRLLDEALPLDAAEREHWLANLSPEHADLAAALREALLRKPGGESAADLLETLPTLGDARLDQPRGGETVGPYRLLRAIGQGGMGSVWLAERADASLKRRVALKLPRLAWGSGLAERMARERDIAALLEHPNIARLYDAGVDQVGRPYLALEYIDGQPIDAWCTEHHLTVPQRLRLFIQVVRAVAYAHGRLVVHRDLKPSNVLVSSDGQTHLLDFGIAKLLHEAGEANAEGLTQQLGRVLTPHFASPEQIRGEAITVASDVYSLGVLLYQLLTAQLPYSGKTMGALERAILEDEPPPASSRVQDKTLARQLRGDLDAILAKALKREAAERYATADALAQDLQRHLDGDPVQARPDSVVYRLRKAVRRHRVAVSATAAALVLVLSAAGIAAYNANRAAHAAERERIFKDFVADVFKVNVTAPTEPGELPSASHAAFLEHSARLVQARFANQPALQAELYAVLSASFAAMGASRLSSEYAARRVETEESVGADAADQARALIQMGKAVQEVGRYAQAEQTLKRAIEKAAENIRLKTDAEVLLALVYVKSERFGEAKQLLDALDERLAAHRDDFGTAGAWLLALRARVLIAANQREQAIPMLDAAIARAIAVEGSDSLVAVEMRLAAARTLGATVYAKRATEYFEAAMATLTRLGNEHQVRAAYLKAEFATYRYRAFRQISAAQALEEVSVARRQLARMNRPLPEEISLYLDFYEGSTHRTFGDVQSAAPLLKRSAPAIYSTAESFSDRRAAALAMGMLLSTLGQHDTADKWLRASQQVRIESGQGRHPYAATDYGIIAVNLAMNGRYDDALSVLDSSPTVQGISGESSTPDRYNLYTRLLRSWILLTSGSAADALKVFPHELISSDVPADRSAASTTLGEILCATGNSREGLQQLKSGLAYMESTEHPNSPELAMTRAIAGNCALRAGDPVEAMMWAKEARAAFVAQPDVSAFFKAPLINLEKALRLRGAELRSSRIAGP